jgi:Domain of unknown function (DUF4111)/Nucleotidyltransferase domain
VTGFPDLDELLAELVQGQRRALGPGFVGAYLYGSFALGDADRWSDVDFLTVAERDPADAERDALQALHTELFARPVEWAQHLDGSYAPRTQLRRTTPDAWLYVDNGSSTLVRDPHCNLALVRWTLREHGVVLAGPPPGELIDPVPPDELRAEARDAVLDYAAYAHEPMPEAPSGMNRWKQAYVVLTLCRTLWTFRFATVTTKSRAAAWARRELPDWADLIDGALADRADPAGRWRRDSTPELVARTRAFADHVARLV